MLPVFKYLYFISLIFIDYQIDSSIKGNKIIKVASLSLKGVH